MTDRDKVLMVYPAAVTEMAVARVRIITRGKYSQAAISGYCSTEAAAWRNAAKRLKATAGGD